MVGVLAVIFVVIPILEIAVIVLVADYIGGLETVALLIAVSMIGAVLAKREGIGVWRRFRAAISRGEIPSAEITDGLLILFGGALLLTPGFVTDLLGLFLLAPFSRPLVKRIIRRKVESWMGARRGS